VSTYLSIHGGTNNYLSSFNISIIIIFHFLLYVVKVLSSLIDHEWRPIRIEFLTLQGKPNAHAGGTKSPTQHFPFHSGSWIRPPPSTTRAPHHGSSPGRGDPLHPHVCGMRTMFQRGGNLSPCRIDQVLKLTDYHISRHVVSTFKRLTTTTTHCGLNQFL